MNEKQTVFSSQEISDKLLERFLRYVKIWTTSDQHKADEGIMPSSEQQKEFAFFLSEELKYIGLSDVQVTENGYVCSRLAASSGYEKAPSICFLAHMDTSPEVSGKNVCPRVYSDYNGSAIRLEDGVILDPEKDSDLKNCAGDTVICSDGTTLLGADDKAGIAIIMTVLDLLYRDASIPHGSVEIIFSPDEETGHGMDKVPLNWINSKAAYTLDGGQAAYLETECFNAWKAEVSFTGCAKHLGTAKPDMVNAVSMAAAFISQLPRNESPEATDGYDGYYCPLEITGQLESSSITVFLRDFSSENMQKRIDTISFFARSVEAQFPGGQAKVQVFKQYINMKEKLDEYPLITEILVQAVKNAGLNPCFKPIRGGTDGSRLTEMGIPTPNIFTGGHNFHSRNEWASLSQMTASVQTVIELIKLWASQE